MPLIGKLSFRFRTKQQVMPLFGKSTKTPAEVVKGLKEALSILEKGDRKADKASEDVSKYLSSLKTMLWGTPDAEPQTEIVSSLSQEIYKNDIIILMVNNLGKLDFECKKDTAQIFSFLLRRQIASRSPTLEYILSHAEILRNLIMGYENGELAQHCGLMLRECARYQELATILLNLEEFYRFFSYVQESNFDIASDAFMTFRELLTKHKLLSAKFLEENYDKFFSEYQKLLTSDNYVTKRQSLKLLGELLLDRHNFTVMTRYISHPENLKLMMNLLKDKSKNIQFEAFHVFKIFVANPKKEKPILDILVRNKDKLVDFLSTFQSERTEDEQFKDEKAYLIKQIKEL